MKNAIIEEIDRNRQILRAAERLFCEKGFQGTSLKDLQKESGCNAALIGYYFGCKDGLRRAVVSEQMQRAHRDLEPLFAAHTPLSPDGLENFVSSLLRMIEKDELFYRLHMWALADGGDLADDMAREMWQPFLSQFADWLAPLRPELDRGTLEARCLVLFGLFQQYANFQWNYLPRLKLTSGTDKTGEAFKQTVLGRILPALFGPSSTP